MAKKQYELQLKQLRIRSMPEVRFCDECGMPFTPTGFHDSRYCTPDCDAYALGLRRPIQKRSKTKQSPELVRAKNLARYAEMKSFIADYKLKFGCKDCGYNEHHVALQFDHVRGDKFANVSTVRTLFQFYQEVEKCEVVCANCHMIRTYARWHIAKGLLDATESN